MNFNIDNCKNPKSNVDILFIGDSMIEYMTDTNVIINFKNPKKY